MDQLEKFWMMDSKDSHWQIGCNRIAQLYKTYLKLKFGCNSVETSSLRIMGPPIQDKFCQPWDTESMIQNSIYLKSED